jgi:hypothetical protein
MSTVTLTKSFTVVNCYILLKIYQADPSAPDYFNSSFDFYKQYNASLGPKSCGKASILPGRNSKPVVVEPGDVEFVANTMGAV